jgi:hypothetical protein
MKNLTELVFILDSCGKHHHNLLQGEEDKTNQRRALIRQIAQNFISCCHNYLHILKKSSTGWSRIIIHNKLHEYKS